MTTRFTVSKSATRQLFMTAAGLVLLLAALDVVVLHRLSDPPRTDDNGVITSKGQTERRTDLVWGTLFTVAGGALVAVGAGVAVPAGQPPADNCSRPPLSARTPAFPGRKK